MSRWCTRQVFRCFKTVERIGDRITGAAGPVFVALAVVLLSIGAFCFCEHPLISALYTSRCTVAELCLLLQLRSSSRHCRTNGSRHLYAS